MARRIVLVRAARYPNVASGSQYVAPRTWATSTGIATCSLHVANSYPSRSAATTTRSTSAMPASASQRAWARGRRVRTGVTMPSRMAQARRGVSPG